MGAYLIDNPPAVRQWYDKRTKPLTGCTVLHTAESVMDTVGPDTGAENVADFIRTRTTAGSYHDLVDSDTAIHLVEYRHGAFHDGTGSNNWALSLSFACRTSDWRTMPAAKRRAFLRQGAIAFARQQAYRRSIGAPLTALRLITKAQSDAGMSGLTFHGLRDPGRRSDPGVAAPNLFPLEEFITECRAVMSGEEDDMPTAQEIATAVWAHPLGSRDGIGPGDARGWLTHAAVHADVAADKITDVGLHQQGFGRRTENTETMVAELTGRPVADVDEQAIVAGLAPLLAGRAAALSDADLRALAAALADEQDRRARDGDPATGSTT